MNNIQLKDKLKNISKEKNVDFNTLLRIYMYDRFIERLSISKFKNNFILKGGFYLSIFFGVENRTTMDIDTAFINSNFDEETIIKMYYLGINRIRDDSEYGGFRVDIQVKLENIKEKFHVDIATGDPITPKEIEYKYKPLLGERYVNLLAYNMETILAEKLETILSRAELNSRMRDFYDIYLIYTKDWQNISVTNFKNAVNKTFLKRAFYGDFFKTFNLIKSSNLLKSKWEIYRRKYGYAKDISFDDILYCIEKMIIEIR